MADQAEHAAKLEHLQKYIPFLVNMMTELKMKGNREAQFNKIRSLHSIITDKKKKLKIETLNRCEEVLNNLYMKVNPQLKQKLHFTTDTPESPRSTPASPSPPRDIFPSQPITIPTEKVSSLPSLVPLKPSTRYVSRVDIYSSAAESLIKSQKKEQDVNRMPIRQLPDMTKPPISFDDLKLLQDDVQEKMKSQQLNNVSISDLQDMRRQLELELRTEEINRASFRQNDRNITISKTNPTKSTGACKDIKPHQPEKKVVKVVKEPDSIFGSLLSSIDNKIIEEKKKIRKDERRSSIKEEHRKEEGIKIEKTDDGKKITEGSFSSDNKDKKREDRRKSVMKDKTKEEVKKKDNEKKQETKCELKSGSKEPKKPYHKRENSLAEKNDSSSCSSSSSSSSSSHGHVEERDKKNKEAAGSNMKEPPDCKNRSEASTNQFRRLADKYNPKPRKLSIDNNVDKEITDNIENNMRKAPVNNPVVHKEPNQPSMLRTPQTGDRAIGSEPIVPLPEIIQNILRTKPPPVINNALPHDNKSPMMVSPPRIMSPTGYIAPMLSPPNNPRICRPLMDHTFRNPRFPRIFEHPSQFGHNQRNIRPLMFDSQPRPNQFSQDELIHNFNDTQFHNYPHNQFENRPRMDFYRPNLQIPSHVPDGPHFMNEPTLFGSKDMDMRVGPWNVHPRNRDARSQNRDPRSYREYKEMKERETRERQNRQQKDFPEIKDPRLANRDVRVNRDPRNRDAVPKPEIKVNTSAPTIATTSNITTTTTTTIANTTTTTTTSTSNQETVPSKENEIFVSPLNSLYTGKEEKKTGKGYGVQPIRISKKVAKQDGEGDELTSDTGGDVSRDEKDINGVEESCDETKKPETESLVGDAKELSETEKKETSDAKQDVKSAEKDTNDEKISEPSFESEAGGKKEESSEQNILSHFFESLLKSKSKKDKKTALFSLIETFSDTFSSKELKKITKIIKTDEDEESSDEEKPKAPTGEDQATEDEPKASSSVSSDPTPVESAEMTKNIDESRVRRISSTTNDEPPVEEENETHSTVGSEETPLDKNTAVEDAKLSDEDESVVVSVGERIKNRKRNAVVTPKRKRRGKTELDLLHEDIQEMFIRDGVLTATGKRMCRILKNDPNVLSSTTPESSSEKQEEVKKIRKKPGPKPKKKPTEHEDVRNSLKDVRVVISKIPDQIIMRQEETAPKRVLRSSTYKNSYADRSSGESSEEEDVLKESVKSDSEYSNTDDDKGDKSETQPVKKKRERRGKKWASGVITSKKRKKRTSVGEETKKDKTSEESDAMNSSADIVEPDKDYYIDPKNKKTLECKLCEFSGRFLTSHYRQVHPNSEVLCSRFSPAIAELAIKDTIGNMTKYESVQDNKISSKYHYVCRFCNFNTNHSPIAFYEHLSTHTGEYRHVCPVCNYSCANGKTMNTHMTMAHPNDERKPVRHPYPYKIIFGYMCGECNYVQLSRNNVEEHVNIFHLGEKPIIHRVNLSTFLDPAIEATHNQQDKDDDKDASSKNTDTPPLSPSLVINPPGDEALSESDFLPEPPKKKKKPGPKSKTMKGFMLEEIKEPCDKEESNSVEKPAAPKKNKHDQLLEVETNAEQQRKTTGRAAKVNAAAKLKSLMEENQDLSKSPLSDVESCTKEVPVKKPVKENCSKKEDDQKEVIKKQKPKDTTPDLNVFTCKTDILQEETKKIEEERLKTMEELNKTIGSRHSRLDFIEKLCTRLKDSQENDKVVVKTEPADEEPLEIPTNEHSTEIDRPMPVLHNEIPELDNPMPKLWKKPVLDDDLPLLTPQLNFPQNKNNSLFSNMIEKLQGKLSEAKPSTSFHSSAMEAEDADQSTPSKESAENSDVVFIAGLIKVIKTEEFVLFSCYAKNCSFAIKDKEEFRQHIKTAHLDLEDVARCEKCGSELTKTPETCLMENVFNHFFSCYSNFVKDAVFVKPMGKVLRMRKLSGDKLSTKEYEKHDEQPLTETEEEDEAPITSVGELEMSPDNPFPFKIADVVSLAEIPEPDSPPVRNTPLTPIKKTISEAQPPPLTLISSKQPPLLPQTHLIVKEAKLTQAELNRPRKTPQAMLKFVVSVGDLYKCPHYYCMFTTNFRAFLERHLKAHKSDTEVMIPCVYCDMKTPWEHVPMHIDIRHAHCRFACSYCLYRAVVKKYVFLHQDQAHADKDYSVIALPQHKHAKKFAIADIKTDPQKLCEPYRCGEDGLEFLFENEFIRHLTVHHDNSTIACGYKGCSHRAECRQIVSHWMQFHGVATYQCGFCKMSSNELTMMYYHFAQFHQSVQPDILIRLLEPMQVNILGFTPEAFKYMKRLDVLPTNIPSLCSPKQKKSTHTITVGKDVTVTAATTKPIVAASGTTKAIPSLRPITPTTKIIKYIVASSSNTPNNILLLPNSTVTNVQLSPKTKLITTVASAGKTVRTSSVATIGNIETRKNEEPVLIDEETMSSTPEEVNLAPVEHIDLGEDTSSSVPEDPLKIPEQAQEPAQTEVDPLSLDPGKEETDPLSLPDVASKSDSNDDMVGSDSMVSNIDDESDSNHADKMNTEKKAGLMNYELFRCASCSLSFANVHAFKSHITKSGGCKKSGLEPFVCVHCERGLKNAARLVEHIQCHGVLRFQCSLCVDKFPTVLQIRGHMKFRHTIAQTTLVPLKADKTNLETDEFVMRPILALPATKENPVEAPKATHSDDTMTFTPDQIEKIPIRQIFGSNVRCGLCNFSTKVRINIVRHLQMHADEKSVPDTAPVNPVPCLEKNEKMFDKMTNLAASSHTGRMGTVSKIEIKEKEDEKIPEFVPTHCRFVCCAQDCNYLCPEEGNLRHHLIALHSDEAKFVCPHCKRDLVPTDADSLIKHFKLHGLHLYKCNYCAFVHNLKHKVERHVTDNHLDMPVKFVTVRYMDSEPNKFESSASGSQTPTTSTPKPKPWRCCMCKYRCATTDDMETHILTKHELDSQFKCTLCTYKSNKKNTFDEHFRDCHPGHEIDIIYVYRKVEEEHKDEKEVEHFDTTPLWQRDRPRVRHIRGILFDEASPQLPAKSPMKKVQKPGPIPKLSPVTKPTPIPKTSPVVKPTPVPKTSPSPKLTTPFKQPTGHSNKNLFDCIEAVANGTAETLQTKTSDDETISDVEEVKQDVSVIVIDDDEEEQTQDVDTPKEKNKDNKQKPMAKNRGFKRKSTPVKDITSKVRKTETEVASVENWAEANADDYSEAKLKLDYGPVGAPHNKQLKCPKCTQFKSKRLFDFIFHIYKDMSVFRFRCKVCNDESITYKYMCDHVTQHKGISKSDAIVHLPPNKKLETWIQMVICEQSSAILSHYGTKNGPEPLSDSASVENSVKCMLCTKRFKNIQDSCEHALTHWTRKPYSCQYCGYDSYVPIEVASHVKSQHSDMEIRVVRRGPTVAQTTKISDDAHKKRCIEEENTTNAKKLKLEDTKLETEDVKPEVTITKMTKPKSDSEDDLVIVSKTDDNVPNEDDVFCCELCEVVADTEALIAAHLSAKHSLSSAHRFKTLKKSREDKKDHMACNVCGEVGTEIQIRRHFTEKHENACFSPFKYFCALCPGKFLLMRSLKIHLNKKHGTKVLSFKSVTGETKTAENEPETTAEIKTATTERKTVSKGSVTYKRYHCTLCSYTAVTHNMNTVRSHVRSHIRPVKCGYCDLSFKYAGDASNHAGKHHSDKPEKIIIDDERLKEYTSVMAEITKNAEVTEHTKTEGVKHVAKKSTSAPCKPSREKSELIEGANEFSYYGLKPDKEDFAKIMTSVEINKVYMSMSVEQLTKIFDLNPIVLVNDCNVGINMSNMFVADDESSEKTELPNS